MSGGAWLALAVALLAEPAKPPDPAHTIKLKAAGPGDTLRVTGGEEREESVKLLGPDGKPQLDRTEKRSRAFDYRETILEHPEGRAHPTRLRRQYEKAVVVEGGKEAKLPYEGKAVVIEAKDGGHQFRVEGGD